MIWYKGNRATWVNDHVVRVWRGEWSDGAFVLVEKVRRSSTFDTFVDGIEVNEQDVFDYIFDGEDDDRVAEPWEIEDAVCELSGIREGREGD